MGEYKKLVIVFAHMIRFLFLCLSCVLSDDGPDNFLLWVCTRVLLT